MQSLEAAAKASESCVLGEAERYMNASDVERTAGKCWECDHFHEIQSSDELPSCISRPLDFCGACLLDGEITIVDRSECHSADECWEVH